MAPTLITAATALLAVASSVVAAPRHIDTRDDAAQLSLTTKLEIADSTIDKFKLLKDEDFVFDFKAGKAPMATRKSFPVLTGTEAALAFADVPPCGMILLHQHPRAHELFIVTEGQLYTEMVPEAGIVDAKGVQRTIKTELSRGQMTLFPVGSMHSQVNMGCDNATAVASFTSDDPGTTVVVSETLALSDDVVKASFGKVFDGKDINAVRKDLPQNAIIMVEQCLKKCGIKKN